MVVEDDPTLVELLSLILGTRGYKVVSASSGQEAITKTPACVDLILLDLLLPDMEGLELCHYFRQTQSTRTVPIMVLSGHRCCVNEKVLSFQLGADDFLCKPFDNEELFARMHSLLRRNTTSREIDLKLKFQLLNELRMIIDQELIEPHFQPMYKVEASCELFGIEVLSRPKTFGLLKDPELLFHVALNLGFYYELETLAWRKALEVLDTKAPIQNIFFNCSPHLVEDNNFYQLHKMFERSSISANNVFLELTERSAISRHRLFYDRLKECRTHGFRIAVDDVGSGYASLESIIETRPEVVKIDRHIVSGLTNDSYKRDMVKFIVSFCHEHDIICVAEGVETKEEFTLLKDLGVKVYQGYYFCKPTPHLDIELFANIAA